MVKTIRVPDEYHACLKAHERGDETMVETLRRLTRGPSPELLSELVTSDEETARETREAFERKRERGRERRADLRERLGVEVETY